MLAVLVTPVAKSRMPSVWGGQPKNRKQQATQPALRRAARGAVSWAQCGWASVNTSFLFSCPGWGVGRWTQSDNTTERSLPILFSKSDPLEIRPFQI